MSLWFIMTLPNVSTLPGIEPRSPVWKARMMTFRPSRYRFTFLTYRPNLHTVCFSFPSWYFAATVIPQELSTVSAIYFLLLFIISKYWFQALTDSNTLDGVFSQWRHLEPSSSNCIWSGRPGLTFAPGVIFGRKHQPKLKLFKVVGRCLNPGAILGRCFG